MSTMSMSLFVLPPSCTGTTSASPLPPSVVLAAPLGSTVYGMVPLTICPSKAKDTQVMRNDPVVWAGRVNSTSLRGERSPTKVPFPISTSLPSFSRTFTRPGSTRLSNTNCTVPGASVTTDPYAGVDPIKLAWALTSPAPMVPMERYAIMAARTVLNQRLRWSVGILSMVPTGTCMATGRSVAYAAGPNPPLARSISSSMEFFQLTSGTALMNASKSDSEITPVLTPKAAATAAPV